MIKLTGSSLNKRHQELNTKVNEAAKSRLSFEEIKYTTEISVVDKLYKIDLALKYKNIDYILEVLKSGDSLYISRALHGDWISDDDFAEFMNPQYLESNVFPFMSLKMKKKLLATLSSHLKNSSRAEEFHHYCMRNRMYNFGMNFLLYTDESFKIDILKLHPHVYNDFNRNEKFVEHFIGNSFILADYYLKVVAEHVTSYVLCKLRYLYSVSEEKFLDLVETFHCREHMHFNYFSLRLSRSIMKRHKNRVLKNPWVYLNMLNHEVVVKYSNSDDAKVYAIAFLPKEDRFWDINYYAENEYFLKLIPLGERFSYVKKIFKDKYPNQVFEEDYNFFTFNFYRMMTVQEKEEWALRHIASEKELHGCGNDYVWYQFVNFQLSFTKLKSYILITPDKDKRSNIVNTLIDSAITEEELNTLLEYYYNNHINELRDYKRTFLNKLIDTHKVLNFNNKCWDNLEKILYSLEVYHNLSQDRNDYQNNRYRVLSLIYNIIHEKPVPEVLNTFLIENIISVHSMRWDFDNDLNPKKLDLIFNYMLRCYTDHVKSLLKEQKSYMFIDEEINIFIFNILDLSEGFDKTIDDIPKIVIEYIKLDFEHFELHKVFEKLRKPANKPVPAFEMKDIMHFLKENSSLVVSKFPTIREYFEGNKGTYAKKRHINWLISKLKIYFSHDIAPEYVKLLNESLDVQELYLQTARVAVYGIFNLSDEEYKINFLKKFVPVESKIDHVNISRNILTIQTAICSIACHSRPPLPLTSFRDYIKGDYLQFCIPIFDSYLTNLTPDQCIFFIETLLDSPVSVQKHGLRLAFHCFSTENLRNLVLKVWKQTKNVSLRKVLYKGLFDKVNYYHDNLVAQWELFGALAIMTHDLHQDDDEELFGLLTSLLPQPVSGQHLQFAYTVVNTFPKRTINYQRLTRIVHALNNNLELISKKFLLGVIEHHIKTILDLCFILNKDNNEDLQELINAKCSLMKKVVIEHRNIHIIFLLSDKCLNKWHKTHDNIYVYRKFWIELLQDLETLSYQASIKDYLEINDIFRTILNEMENILPSKEIYVIVWNLKLDIITRQILGEAVPKINETQNTSYTANTLIKETILNFCIQIRTLMEEYIEIKEFYPSLYNEIKNILSGKIYQVSTDIYRCYGYSVDSYQVGMDINTLLCSVLLEHDKREFHIFVMNFILSIYDGEYNTEYTDAIIKLKSLEDEDIKHFMCHTFFSSDYQYRHYMP